MILSTDTAIKAIVNFHVSGGPQQGDTSWGKKEGNQQCGAGAIRQVF